MSLFKFFEVLNNSPKRVGIEVSMSMNILDRINDLFQEKFKGDKDKLAEKMGISVKQLTGYLNGVQNYDIRTISMFEEVFNEKIIIVVNGN